MKLSDIDIKKAMDAKQIVVDPLFPNSINGASVDLHLGRHFMVFIKNNITHIDPKKPVEKKMRHVTINHKGHFLLNSGEFALGVLQESVGVDNSHMGILDGISGIGRLGTCVHITASTLNPGHTLRMTLELHNMNDVPIKLYWGMPIAQMMFEKLSNPCEHTYGPSTGYSGEKPQASQYFKKFGVGKNEWMEFVKTLK